MHHSFLILLSPLSPSTYIINNLTPLDILKHLNKFTGNKYVKPSEKHILIAHHLIKMINNDFDSKTIIILSILLIKRENNIQYTELVTALFP